MNTDTNNNIRNNYNNNNNNNGISIASSSLSSSPRCLYGRDREAQILLDLGTKIIENNNIEKAHLCLVHGPSGSGKTSLCLQLQQQLLLRQHALQQQQQQQQVRIIRTPSLQQASSRESESESESESIDDIIIPQPPQPKQQLIFLQGKFDQFVDYSSPYSALVQAFDGLGRHLIKLSKQQQQQQQQPDLLPVGMVMVQQLLPVLEQEGSILVHLIPSFSKLLARLLKKKKKQQQKDNNNDTSISNNDDDEEEEEEEDKEKNDDSRHSQNKNNNATVVMGKEPKGGGDSSSDDEIIKVTRGDDENQKSSSNISNNERSYHLSFQRSSSTTTTTEHQQQPPEPRRLELASERLAVGFRSFLRRLCTPPMQQPLILFVDDLQWCDKESLEILAAMVEESAEIANFLLLGGYRDDNEHSRNHIQSCLVDRILCTTTSSSKQQQQPWTDIAIGNLNVDCVNAMIADVLSTSSSIKNIDNNHDDNNDPDDMKYQDDDNIQINDRKNDNSFLELGRLVHSKTKGNPYFVLQFLGILKRKHLLSFNDKVNQWEWDIHNIQTQLLVTTTSSNSTSSSNNIVTKNNSTNASSSVPETNDDVSYFVTQRILTLSPDLRRILKLAACLGFSINLKLLETLDRMELQFHQEKIVGTGLSLQRLETATAVMDHAGLFQRAMDQAAAEHLLHYVGGGSDDGTTVCSFTHDRVQQCVYELIPEERIRDELHFRTGKNLLHLYQEGQEQEQEQQETQEGHLIVNQDTELLFLAADQCNRGSTCVEHLDHERKALIQLNLQASQAARSKAGALLVALFLDKAVALTREEDWRSSMFYGIVLEVHSLSAEVDSARGSYDRSNARVEVILNKAMCHEDMIRAIAVQARSHGAQQEYTAALSKMKRALTILGVKVPPSGLLRLMMEIWKLKRLIKHKTEDDFLLLPPMTDKRMMLAMKILQMGVVWGWNADVYFGLLSYVVMVQISLTYGRCNLTPFAVAGLGNILANFGDDAKGYWFGQLARRFDEGKEALPATTMVVHCYSSHLRKPASESLEPLLAAYRVSLETGDLYMGTICLCVHHWVCKFCGLPLGNFMTDLRSYLAELKICQQDYLLAFLLPDLYLALNLKGESESPLVISWDMIERAESFTYKTVLANQHLTHPAELNRCYTQMFNAIVLGDIECIKETMHLILARKKVFRRFDGSHIANQFFAFWDGLASFALLRRKRSRRFRGVANQSIKVLTRMSTSGSVNCVGMLHLLKAEKASLHFAPTQEIDKFLYDDAISQLFRSGFVHFSAIANERAGEFMLRRKDQYWAQQYLSRALALYKKWGALVKIHQLQEKYSFVMTSDDGFRGVEVAVHGRKRYSAVLDSLKHVSADSSEIIAA